MLCFSKEKCMFNPIFLNISGDIQSKVIEYMSLKRSGSEVHSVFLHCLINLEGNHWIFLN